MRSGAINKRDACEKNDGHTKNTKPIADEDVFIVNFAALMSAAMGIVG